VFPEVPGTCDPGWCCAWLCRWEGRPSTPPFQWGGTCELLPPHDSWLRALDLRQEGLAGLVEGLEEGELAATQQLLVQHAGGRMHMPCLCRTMTLQLPHGCRLTTHYACSRICMRLGTVGKDTRSPAARDDAWVSIWMLDESCVGSFHGSELGLSLFDCPACTGALQMLFLYYSCEGCSSPEQIGRLTLPQFRSMAVAAKVVSAQFTADRVDDIFTRVATSESVLNRCVHVLPVLPESKE
jgi:hypothetical protein